MGENGGGTLGLENGPGQETPAQDHTIIILLPCCSEILFSEWSIQSQTNLGFQRFRIEIQVDHACIQYIYVCLHPYPW